ncbi:DUF6461 domain-containing protein [Actinocorallia sp. A-T 12471]|uniref:DUF6461 domain-containing protein n=1 Tax=Actinocorallia sp. A-T 12471 TaxID=3089813 RepID=UPI0029CBAE58|nr:DUF6461 domain-containing protein [Actinocorallia sp. A-T 12471]MDX6742923.1 DUF6461 domain-containing protein [Actinocorallia sp. A-T 12471]
MSASASGYAWYREYRHGLLTHGYCLAFVEGLSPAEYLARLAADAHENCDGMDAYLERDMRFQDAQEDFGDQTLVGATAVRGSGGPWTLAVEINGLVGIDEQLMPPASRGTRIFAHYLNINALRCFYWWQDGEQRTAFESPWQRYGSMPDGLLPAMARVGYDLSDPETAYDEPVKLGTPGLFALAEELTGVRVSPELLDTSVYTTGIVTMPVPEPARVVIDVTDAHGDRFHREFR